MSNTTVAVWRATRFFGVCAVAVVLSGIVAETQAPAGLGQSAAYRSLMWFTKTDGASLSGICSDLVTFTRRCLSRRTDRLASVILNVRGRNYNSRAVRR